MNVLVLLAHPDENSFNSAIAKTAVQRLEKNGYHVIFHDLYREEFNPVVLTEEIRKDAVQNKIVQKHCDELVLSDGIIIIHPNWWGQPPAILKGWIDKVIRPGVAYEFEEEDSGEGIPLGLLKATTAIIFNTSDTAALREDTVFQDPLQTIWENCILKFCGVKNIYRKIFRIVVTSSHEQRTQWLKEADQTIDSHFPALHE
jgi:NAD(P)H dehydrogenase (quinone)